MLDTKQPMTIREEKDGYLLFFPNSGIVMHSNPVGAFWMNGLINEQLSFEYIAEQLRVSTNSDIEIIKSDGRKYLAEAESILSGKKDTPPIPTPALPTNVELYIGKGCNLRCGFCPQTTHSGFTPTEKVLEMITFLVRDIKIFFLKILGGETLLHPGIWEILNLASSYGVHLTIITNGSLVTDATADRLASYKSLTTIVSIDGIQMHDILRKKQGLFELSFGAVKKMAIRKKPVGITFTLNRHNKHEWKELVGMGTEIGATVGINPTKPYHAGDFGDALPPDELFELFVDAYRMKLSGANLELMIPPLESVLNGDSELKDECDAGTVFTSVMEDGSLSPCSSFFYADGHRGAALPNIFELMTAWHSHPEINAFRKVFDRKGCAVRNLLFGGSDPYSPEKFREYLKNRGLKTPLRIEE